MLRLATCESDALFTLIDFSSARCVLSVFGYALEGLKREKFSNLKLIFFLTYELLLTLFTLNQFSQKTIISD